LNTQLHAKVIVLGNDGSKNNDYNIAFKIIIYPKEFINRN